MKRLEDRIVVVTGASSGIGRATALAFAEAGAHLALADVDATGLAETRRLVLARGRKATEHVVDVASEAMMRELVAAVEREHGAAHVLVNNAGVSVAASFEDQPLEDFAWLMGINFWGVVYGCKLFLPLLRRADEAHIVNVSSVFGLVGVPLNSSYCASKFAVVGLSESLRAELADSNVGVTCVHPGGVATNIARSARFTEPKGMEGLQRRTVTAFERMLPPERAARRIVAAVRRNSPRLLITREAYLIDVAKRVMPVVSVEVVRRSWKRLADLP
jgi:NAD(P)-dependent dehydrogenase (short-subunit alcohol dehydrogenase family)